MKKLIGISFAAVSFTCLGLAQDVQYNFEPGTDFSKYKTYRWEKHPKSLDLDELTMGQLGKGFDAALATKGLRRQESEPTDLVIVYQLALNQEKEITTYDMGGYGYGPGWRGGWYGSPGMSTSTTTTLNIGSVAIDMYDTASKKLVWRGMASKTLDPKAKPEKRQKNIDKAAAKMLKNYPPKVKS